jgi:hypothetical protein
MLVAYLTTDEVNWNSAAQLAEESGIVLYPLTYHEQFLDVQFDAVLYDWDFIHPLKRQKIKEQLLADQFHVPVALHSYHWDNKERRRLRQKGIPVFRRLGSEIFRFLQGAINHGLIPNFADKKRP